MLRKCLFWLHFHETMNDEHLTWLNSLEAETERQIEILNRRLQSIRDVREATINHVQGGEPITRSHMASHGSKSIQETVLQVLPIGVANGLVRHEVSDLVKRSGLAVIHGRNIYGTVSATLQRLKEKEKIGAEMVDGKTRFFKFDRAQ